VFIPNSRTVRLTVPNERQKTKSNLSQGLKPGDSILKHWRLEEIVQSESLFSNAVTGSGAVK
jgi:hypothetical protein